jgi:hypothetical protein
LHGLPNSARLNQRSELAYDLQDCLYASDYFDESGKIGGESGAAVVIRLGTLTSL